MYNHLLPKPNISAGYIPGHKQQDKAHFKKFVRLPKCLRNINPETNTLWKPL